MTFRGAVLAAQLQHPLRAANQRLGLLGVSHSLPAGAPRHFYFRTTFMCPSRGFLALKGRSNGLLKTSM